jgi:hypothetical protein
MVEDQIAPLLAGESDVLKNVLKLSKLLRNVLGEVIEWKTLIEKLCKEHKIVVAQNQLGVTAELAQLMMGTDGFFTSEGIKLSIKHSGDLNEQECCCACLRLLRQPIMRGLGGKLLPPKDKAMTVTYVFTNRHVILYCDEPASRGTEDYDPIRWREPLVRIESSTITFRGEPGSKDDPAEVSICQRPRYWVYDYDMYSHQEDLMRAILAAKQRCLEIPCVAKKEPGGAKKKATKKKNLPPK